MEFQNTESNNPLRIAIHMLCLAVARPSQYDVSTTFHWTFSLSGRERSCGPEVNLS